jgi:hypothetical protein
MASDLYSRQGAIGVEGLASTIRTMKALGDDTATIKEALRQAALTMAEAAKDTIPEKTGKLKRTLRVSATNYGSFVLAGTKKVPYANPIHWGWFVDRKSDAARKSSRGYIKKNIKPNPFFSKALGYTKEEIFRNFTDIMETEITNTVRRGIGGRIKTGSNKSQVR